jgi:hypothetical protein
MVTFARCTHSGRYVSYSCNDLDDEIANSGHGACRREGIGDGWRTRGGGNRVGQPRERERETSRARVLFFSVFLLI